MEHIPCVLLDVCTMSVNELKDLVGHAEHPFPDLDSNLLNIFVCELVNSIVSEEIPDEQE